MVLWSSTRGYSQNKNNINDIKNLFCDLWRKFWSFLLKIFLLVSLEVSCSRYFYLKYPCQTYFYLKYPCQTYFYLKYPRSKYPCSKYFCSKHSCSKYLSSKYPCSKYPCSKTFMFKISLLKMSQQHVPRGGIFVVVFFKHYKMALWPISKTYEVNYAYLQ